METKKKKSYKRRQEMFTAVEKCEAVLAIWGERRKPVEICREMGIRWMELNQWQNRAMDAMLEALEPRRKAPGPKLNLRLVKLLQKHRKNQQRVKLSSSLEKRLQDVQKPKEQPKTAAA